MYLLLYNLHYIVLYNMCTIYIQEYINIIKACEKGMHGSTEYTHIGILVY